MSKLPTTPSRSSKRVDAKKRCEYIVALMVETEKLRRGDSCAVMLSAPLWKTIYHHARKGAK